MSSSDEEIVMILLLEEIEKRKKRKRRFWVHPHHKQQPKHGTFVVTREMAEDPKKFQSFYRMYPETFKKLAAEVAPAIFRCDTNCREAVCPEERLLITLRYLATGSSFRALTFHFMRGETTIGAIVYDTCKALWSCLNLKYMPVPTAADWERTASQFMEMWQMPNCIGSIDGKHIRIKAPAKSGSSFFNYKEYFSIVLLAVTDANSMFKLISVGDFGRNSDGGVFNNSPIGKSLKRKLLNIPSFNFLPNNDVPFPYFFVGDEAFPLMSNLLKPYPQRQLTNTERVFNYRLSRARKTVECAFGRMASKFRVFLTPISCAPERIDAIVKSACILHNFIYMEEKNVVERDENESLGIDLEPYIGRPEDSAMSYRNLLATFFTKPENAVSSQWQYCV